MLLATEMGQGREFSKEQIYQPLIVVPVDPLEPFRDGPFDIQGAWIFPRQVMFFLSFCTSYFF